MSKNGFQTWIQHTKSRLKQLILRLTQFHCKLVLYLYRSEKKKVAAIRDVDIYKGNLYKSESICADNFST